MKEEREEADIRLLKRKASTFVGAFLLKKIRRWSDGFIIIFERKWL